jgi:ubiquinone/menaquinone biosynthesis C-methylase UbiE
MFNDYAHIFERVPLVPGQKVLDVGSGSGNFTFELATRLGKKGTVYAVDHDAIGLETLLADADKKQLHTIVGIKGDAGTISSEIPKNSLDGAFFIWSFPYLEDSDKVFENVKNFLRPGGYLVLLEWTHSLTENFPSNESLVNIPQLRKQLLGHSIGVVSEYTLNEYHTLIVAKIL